MKKRRITAWIVAVIMLAGLIPFTAVFEVLAATDNFNITIPVTQGGTITIAPDLTEAAVDTPITLTVTPDSEYRLKAGTLKVNGDDSSTVVTITGTPPSFIMPEDNVTITAEFERIYTITVTLPDPANGTVIPNVTTAAAVETITLIITPDSGYILKDDTLKFNDEPITETDSIFTFIMPAEAVEITAEFEPIPVTQYEITVTPPTNGNVTANVATAAAGTTITLTVTPASGYRLKAGTLKVNDGAVAITGNTFIMPAAPVTITAEFEEIIVLPKPGATASMAEWQSFNKQEHNIEYTPRTNAGNPIIPSDPTATTFFRAGKDRDTGTAAARVEGADHLAEINVYRIDLVREMIIVVGELPEANRRATMISYNGGVRWQSVTIPPTGLDISKSLNRGATIHLATAFTGKEVPEYVALTEDGPPASGRPSVWIFPQIGERPKISKATVDYFTHLGTLANDFNDQWTLDIEGGVSGLDIAVAGSDRRTPDAAGWGRFAGSGDNFEGIRLQPLTAGRAVRTNYLLRVVPDLTPGRLTPGSVPRRMAVGGYARSTAFRLDYRRETIRARVGSQFLSRGLLTTITDRADTIIDISGNYEETLRFRNVPTEGRGARRAPSQWQEITIAPRDILTVAAVTSALRVTNGKITSSNTRLEFLIDSERNRWGRTPARGDTSPIARLRADARFDARTNRITSGRPASNRVQMIIDMGNIGTDARPREGITGIRVDLANINLTANEVVLVPQTLPTANAIGGISGPGTDYTPNTPIMDRAVTADNTNGTILAQFDVLYGDNMRTAAQNPAIIPANWRAVIEGTAAAMFDAGELVIEAGTSKTVGTRIIQSLIVRIGTDGIKATGDPSGLRFIPGNLTVQLVPTAAAIAATGDDTPAGPLAGIALHNPAVSRTFQATPNVVQGTPAANSPNIGIAVAQAEVAGSMITFTRNVNSFWGGTLGELEYTIMPNAAAPPNDDITSPLNFSTNVDANTTTTGGYTISNAVVGGTVWVRVSAGRPLPFAGNPPGTWVRFHTFVENDIRIVAVP